MGRKIAGDRNEDVSASVGVVLFGELTSKIERHRSVHEPAALTPSYSGVISAFRASTVKPIRFRNSWFFMGTGAPREKGSIGMSLKQSFADQVKAQIKDFQDQLEQASAQSQAEYKKMVDQL